MSVREAYDRVARRYAAEYFQEIDRKPIDRALLKMYADRVPRSGDNVELGCGPGEVSRYLKDLGVDMQGLDLSSGMVEEARRLNPDLRFTQGDVLDLPFTSGSIDSIVAFYLIVNFTVVQVREAFAEMHRVLRGGGQLLISFHIGDQTIHIEEFLGEAVDIDFTFFDPDVILDYLRAAGFQVDDVVVRYPYPGVEYESRRCYIFAHKG